MKNKNKYLSHKNKIFHKGKEISFPEFPILVYDQINLNYYYDIYRYLLIKKYKLENIERYPEYIISIKNSNERNDKKLIFRRKTKHYYIDNENNLYKKLKKNKKKIYPINHKEIIEKNIIYVLYKIPNTYDILHYLNNLHVEDNHRGISSLRSALDNKLLYIEGITSLISLILNNCITCIQKNKATFKREPSGIILTKYPKQRYVMDITELPKEFNKKNKLYLFNIIDHFSKFGMSYIITDKKSETVLQFLKISFEINGYPEELGSDNGKEFKNLLIENYLRDNNIKFIHGNPYNPHSQGVVERFHQTIKDLLYCYYFDENKNSIYMIV